LISLPGRRYCDSGGVVAFTCRFLAAVFSMAVTCEQVCACVHVPLACILAD